MPATDDDFTYFDSLIHESENELEREKIMQLNRIVDYLQIIAGNMGR